MSDRDHRSKFKTGAEVLQSLLSQQQGPVSDQFKRWKLWMNWEEVVGATTAQNCEPVAYHNGVLWLWVKNSAWMTQISFMAEVIKNTINQKYSANMVSEIRLTLDRKNVPSQSNNDFKSNLQKFIKK